LDKAIPLISFLATDPRPEQPTAERIEWILDALRVLKDRIKTRTIAAKRSPMPLELRLEL
jgi:hypothetical protein